MISVTRNIYDQIVATCLNGDDRGFDHDTDLQAAGVLDSFSTLSLVAFIEETFKVQLDPVDINAETFKSVTTIAELTVRKLHGRM
jgi:acyl carrier protein